MLEALQLLHLAKMRYPDVERSIEDFTPLSGKEKLNLEENEHLHLINTFTKYLSVCVIDRGEGRYFGIYMDRDRYLRPQLINSRNFRSEFKKILKDVKYDESEIEYILREGTLDKDVMPYTLILSALRSKVSSMSTHLEFNDIKDGKLDIHGSYIADLLTALITRVLDTEKDIWEEILKAFEEYYGTFKVSYVTFSGLRYDSKRNTPVFMESVFDRNAPIPYAMLSTGTRNIVSMVMTLAIAKVLLSRGYAERLIIGIEEPEITLSYTSVTAVLKKICFDFFGTGLQLLADFWATGTSTSLSVQFCCWTISFRSMPGLSEFCLQTAPVAERSRSPPL